MKNTINKAKGKDSGIAIMFSLIMLSIFFLIAFGFVSMATSTKAAAKARQPAEDGSLSAEATVLNEALFAINEGLMKNSGVDSEIPDYSKMNDFKFLNGAATEVSFKVWSTRGVDQTNLSTNLPLQLYTVDEFYPDTNTGTNAQWGNTGWITTEDLNGDATTDKYFWMVVESSGIDPNYIGGTAGLTTGNRQGIYTRELDVNQIDSNFSGVYVDWTAATPMPWTDKKSLVNTLGAALETAIQLFEPGTSPVELTDMTAAEGRFDLSLEQPTFSEVFNGITWLSGSSNTSEAQKLAANIKDFIDKDNKTYLDNTTAPTIIGVERVPFLSELAFTFNNSTGPDPDSSTSLTVSVTPEFINPWHLAPAAWNVFDDTDPEASGGSPDGATATLVLETTITANRAGGGSINTTKNFEITFPLDTQTATNVIENSTLDDSDTFTAATTTASTSVLTDVTVTITKAVLYGSDLKTTIWDFHSNIGAAVYTNLISGGDFFANLTRGGDPRERDPGNWSASQSLTAIPLGTYSYGGTLTDGDIGAISTLYMPPGGAISNLSELGFIHRGTAGETINLTDYNISNPGSFVSANYRPTGNLDLATSSSFNGGDRSLLNYVYISSPGLKVTSAGSVASYKQFGMINPNTSQSSVIQLLLTDVNPTPLDTTATVATAELSSIIGNFPGINSNSSQDEYFKVSDFHDINGDGYHNRNPKTFGYPFSRNIANNPPYTVPAAPSGNFSDADREALVMKSMNLVSPKFIYFTVIGAVDISGTITKVKAFVRRDADSGSFKIIRFTIN